MRQLVNKNSDNIKMHGTTVGEKKKKIMLYVMKYRIRLYIVVGLPKHVCLAVYICNTMVYLKFPGLGQ